MKIVAAIVTLAFVAATTQAVSLRACSNNELVAALPATALVACQTTTDSQAKLICTKCPDLLAALAKTTLPSCRIVLSAGFSVTVDQYFPNYASCAAYTSTADTTAPPPATTTPSAATPTAPPASSGSNGSNGSSDTPVPTNTVTGSSMGSIDILLSNTTEATTKPTTIPIASAGVRVVTLGAAAAVAFASVVTGGLAL